MPDTASIEPEDAEVAKVSRFKVPPLTEILESALRVSEAESKVTVALVKSKEALLLRERAASLFIVSPAPRVFEPEILTLPELAVITPLPLTVVKSLRFKVPPLTLTAELLPRISAPVPEFKVTLASTIFKEALSFNSVTTASAIISPEPSSLVPLRITFPPVALILPVELEVAKVSRFKVPFITLTTVPVSKISAPVPEFKVTVALFPLISKLPPVVKLIISLARMLPAFNSSVDESIAKVPFSIMPAFVPSDVISSFVVPSVMFIFPTIEPVCEFVFISALLLNSKVAPEAILILP